MNIIFLDVDGVLNSLSYLKELCRNDKRPYSGYDYPFDPRCMNNLKRLVEETDSYLVISSCWRMHEIGKKILLSELKKYGLDTRVIGYTKILHKTRGEEIKEFIKILDENVHYIIIDDDSDFADLKEYLVKTNYQNGLTEKETDVAIKKLTMKKNNKL